MPIISGPSKEFVFSMAQDYAEAAVEIHRLPQLDAPEQEKAIGKLKAAGGPTSLPELVDMAAAAVIRHRLGWYRKNQFFGGLQGFCVLMGMPKADAAYLLDLIRAKVRPG